MKKRILSKFSLTIRLTLLIIGIIMIGIMALAILNGAQVIQDRKGEQAIELSSITASLATHASLQQAFLIRPTPNSVTGTAGLVNEKLQALVDQVIIGDKQIKYGYYSIQADRIVAIGPQFDEGMLQPIPHEVFAAAYETGEALLAERSFSLVWYGSPILYSVHPITYAGEIVGHSFASVNLGTLYIQMAERLGKIFIGALLVCFCVSWLVHQAMRQFRMALQNFSVALIRGEAEQYSTDLPELKPLMRVILEQKLEMERLDRLNLVGEMAASIGHEVRNPLTTVRGFLQFLSFKPEYRKDAERFAIMIEELDRANGIITEYLSLSKDRSVQLHQTNINDIIARLLPLLQADAVSHGVEILAQLEALPKLMLDEKEMHQLILNLVRNAVEAMPGGGKIMITTSMRDDIPVLTVEDQGTGIPEEVLKKMGTPFFSTKPQGVGLGLAVCYRIAQRHNAQLQVKSEIDKGTIFELHFSKIKQE